MIHTFIPSNAPISEQDIINFEELIGTDLPQEYRQFILQYNGGEFENSIYKGVDEYLIHPDFYPLVNNIDINGDVKQLFVENPYYYISLNNNLIIGGDIIGNILLLSYDCNKYGHVHLFMQDREDEPIILISKSFSDIIKNMQEMED